MNEALGASQVLSYLYKLSEKYEFHLVSLEKSMDFQDKKKMSSLDENLKNYGIFWHPVEYKTDKVGKLLNFPRIFRKVYSVLAKEKIQNVHCRSYMTAIIALLLKSKFNLRYLFDTRNFSFDERADVGALNRNGIIYKLTKKLEKKLYQNASAISILSEKGKETILKNELFPGGNQIKNIEVITTCVDLDRFSFQKRDYDKNKYTIGYVGTAVGWYDFEKTIKTLKKIGESVNFHFLVFNSNAHGQHKFIAESLQKIGIPDNQFTIEKVSFQDMPLRLKEMDISLFFIHPYFSKRASAATKLGELLASGIPVLTNNDVGDHEYIIENFKVGKILDFEKIDTYDFQKIFRDLINYETAKRCRDVSEQYFSLEKGVEKYYETYAKIFR